MAGAGQQAEQHASRVWSRQAGSWVGRRSAKRASQTGALRVWRPAAAAAAGMSRAASHPGGVGARRRARNLQQQVGRQLAQRGAAAVPARLRGAAVRGQQQRAHGGAEGGREAGVGGGRPGRPLVRRPQPPAGAGTGSSSVGGSGGACPWAGRLGHPPTGSQPRALCWPQARLLVVWMRKSSGAASSGLQLACGSPQLRRRLL